jgi:hypothetical protein
MGEQGWREFLAADGVDDWVVLHGGATAVFRVRSLGEAAQLAEAVSHIPASRLRSSHDGRQRRSQRKADPRLQFGGAGCGPCAGNLGHRP